MKNSTKKKTSGAPSIKETLTLHYRALRLLNKSFPGVYPATLLNSAWHALTPYVGIWISARLLNELAGAKDPGRLRTLVLLALITGAGTALVGGLLKRWKNYCLAPYWDQQKEIFRDKMLDMDFPTIDDQQTHELYSQIWQASNWMNWGLPRINGCFDSLIGSVMGLAGAFALTVSFFTLPVPASAGALCLLDHPLTVLGVIALLIAVTVLAPLCHTKADAFFTRRASTFTGFNRIFAFHGHMAIDDKSRSLDVRMYNQHEICQHHLWSIFWTDWPAICRAASGPVGLLQALGGALSMAFIGIVYVFVCLKAWAGAFGVGNVTQYIGAVTALSQNISGLFRTLGELRNNTVFLRATFEFLDLPNKMYQGSLTTEKRSDRNYQVEFKDVSFRYPGSDAWALRHVSLKFRVGSRLAVVGQNGSGKTTFIKLLCRLYDPTEGEILLNGIDIRKYRYDDYLSVFSVVFQDFKLLPLPLGQNVAVCRGYDEDRVRDCLEKAGFADRLAEMKKGTDTWLYRDLDADGIEISGGEAQKLAIARALYKDAPFIILDEPTAALDPIAEMEIYQKFDAIAGDKTAIYISHRLSSCRFCDDIAVFDQGSLIQQGSHDKLLLDKDGKYFQLWNAQAQYYRK